MIDSFSFVQSLKVVVDLAIQSRLWFTVAEFIDLVFRMLTALGSWSKVAGFVDLNIRTLVILGSSSMVAVGFCL
ncbi:hypothetical protein G4B88_008010 [Cannabis sativa]|uniref:Uncharacterized protein n=1 Tax=Cannabis sativa TaxID=3483 RepID=A0A7J6I6Z1_CANSA|nr:hypothetical protein G4B88_008010 [Cannabis sativa]